MQLPVGHLKPPPLPLHLSNADKHRQETVVGWYHSHPGFGCWLSSVDINTQQSFEQLTPRAVAVVVDPIQSVKGKVVIDAFRIMYASTRPFTTTARLDISTQ
jgi:proteasome lid subunit RPN8/RPN11